MTRWPADEPEPALEDEEELAGEWELDPNDPSHPDHDLSESAGYSDWDPAPKPWYVRRGALLLIAVLVIIGLLFPTLARIF